MRFSNHYIKPALFLGFGVMLADQLSKWWLVNTIMQPPHAVAVAPFFNLVLVRNKGVTFGLLNTINRDIMPYVLAAVAGGILLVLGRWLWRTHSKLVAYGLGLVMGGAVGNILDRIREGAVVDFLDFYYQNHHWFAFNIADAAIVTGVSLLVFDSLVRAR